MDYATINRTTNRVTAITLGAGALPASTTAILYFDITTYSPQPAVNDYFDELCLVFSATPFVSSPGSVAPSGPAFTPSPHGGSTGGSYLPAVHSFFKAGQHGPVTLTAIPPQRLARTEYPVIIVDPRQVCQVELQAQLETPTTGIAILALEYSSNGTEWYALDGFQGPWLSLAGAAGSIARSTPIVMNDAFTSTPPFVMYLRLVTEFGDGTSTTVTLGNVSVIFYQRTQTYMACNAVAATFVPCGPDYDATLLQQGDDFQGNYNQTNYFPQALVALNSGLMTGGQFPAPEYATDLDGAEGVIGLYAFVGSGGAWTWDPTKPFNGWPSLNIQGNGFIQSDFTDAATPPTPEVRVVHTDVWARIRIRLLDLGFTGAQNLIKFDTNYADGSGPVENVAGTVQLDLPTNRLYLVGNHDGDPEVRIDIGSGSLIRGKGFVDIIAHLVETGSSATLDAWYGIPCVLAPVPLGTMTWATNGNGFRSVLWREAAGTQVGWLAGISIVPGAIDPNPFTV